MTETIEIHVERGGKIRLVGYCRCIAKGRGQSSVFSYSEDWLAYSGAFALDPANLPLGTNPIYSNSDKSALPGAMRDTAPDRWGQQLIKRAFRKSGETRSLSEIDYLLAINDQTRIGALRYKRD
jgi:serine/threonine-protein kinase HipA